MESTLSNSSPSSYSLMLDEEEDTTREHLNEACLLSDTEPSFDDDDRGSSDDFSNVAVPETPHRVRRKRHSQVTDNCSGAALCGPDTKRSEGRDMIPGYPVTTPVSHRSPKRRRLQVCGGYVNDVQAKNGTGFVPASSLPYDFKWLESPRPSQSTISFSSTSSTSCPATDPECSELGAVASHICSSKTSHGRASEQKLLKCNKEQRPKKTSSRISHGSSRCTSTARSPAAEETHLYDTERKGGGLQEEIVVIDEDDDDMVVEATVRSIQMAEDEAFARSLQEQFDREEQLHQEQSQLQTTSPSRPSQGLPFDSYVGLSWISPWASMMQTAAFSELQQAIVVGQPRSQMGPWRGRGSRRRNSPYVPSDLLDDNQGNNYEALLEFEELQGAVMAKKTLSKGEIDRLPTKAYDPIHNAGKTDCQICFSDYKKGEKLRMLPCFHDYHVRCIDRWLKENATCPICRVDVSL